MSAPRYHVNPETHETEACFLCRSLDDSAFPTVVCGNIVSPLYRMPVLMSEKCEHFRSRCPRDPEFLKTQNKQEG